MQRAREKIRCAGKPVYRFWRTHRPRAGAICLRLKICSALRGEHPNGRKLRRRLFLCCIATTPHRHRHVRLPRGQPNLTHKHVLYNKCVVALHRQRALHGGIIDGIQSHHPFAVFTSGGGFRLAGELHCHFFARIGPTPHGRHRPALQNHVVTENCGKFHIRPRDKRHEAQKKNKPVHAGRMRNPPPLRKTQGAIG